MRRLAVTSSLLAALLLAQACGGDDEAELGADELKAAQALAAEFQGPGPTAAKRDNGACLGKELVRRAGVDRLVESGMLNEDLSVNEDLPETVPSEVASAYADAFVECQDLRAELRDVQQFYPGLTEETIDLYVDCMGRIDDTLLRAAVLASATRGSDSDSAADDYRAAAEPCTELLGVPGGEIPVDPATP